MQTLVFLFTLIFGVAASAMPVHAETRMFSWWTEDVIIQLPEGVYVDELPRGKHYYSLQKVEEIIIKATPRQQLDKVRDINDFMKSFNKPYTSRRIKNKDWKEIAKPAKGELNGTLYFLDVDRLIQVSYRFPVSSAWAKSLDSIEVIEKPKMILKDPSCPANNCICIGNNGVYYRGRLNETGPNPSELKKGVRCVAADFDGNGIVDYAIPGAEGSANIFLMDQKDPKAVVRIDAGGVLELYQPRKTKGPEGEPISEHYGLLVRWVGQDNVVFIWNGRDFKTEKFPAR
jgi:hypothetical protein